MMMKRYCITENDLVTDGQPDVAVVTVSNFANDYTFRVFRSDLPVVREFMWDFGFVYMEGDDE